MGLGPRKTSLLERLDAPPPVWSNPFAMQMEGISRGQARREKAIWHSMRHAHPKRPEAPVRAMTKEKGYARMWCWIGEAIESKCIIPGKVMTAAQIRAAGFKLPNLEKAEAKPRKRKVKDEPVE